jgi:hypothetical protein
VQWNASRVVGADLRNARFDELYDHSNDSGVDFNQMDDTINLAYVPAHAATVEHMFDVARSFFAVGPAAPLVMKLDDDDADDDDALWHATRHFELRLELAQQQATNAVNEDALRALLLPPSQPLLSTRHQHDDEQVPISCCGILPSGPPPPPSQTCTFQPLWRFEMPPFLTSDGPLPYTLGGWLRQPTAPHARCGYPAVIPEPMPTNCTSIAASMPNRVVILASPGKAPATHMAFNVTNGDRRAFFFEDSACQSLVGQFSITGGGGGVRNLGTTYLALSI